MSHFDLRPWCIRRMEDWVQNRNATYALCDCNLALPSRYQISYPMWMARVCAEKHTHSLHLDKKQTYQIHNINQFKYDINHSISFKFNIILYQYKSFNIWILISNHSISFSNSGMLSSHSSDIETSQKRRALPSKGRLRKSVKIETGWDHGDPFKIHLSHI